MYRGKSTNKKFLSLIFLVPIALLTVLPVQLPVCCLRPVKALKIVDLPTLGLPASPIVKSQPIAFSKLFFVLKGYFQ